MKKRKRAGSQLMFVQEEGFTWQASAKFRAEVFFLALLFAQFLLIILRPADQTSAFAWPPASSAKNNFFFLQNHLWPPRCWPAHKGVRLGESLLTNSRILGRKNTFAGQQIDSAGSVCLNVEKMDRRRRNSLPIKGGFFLRLTFLPLA